MVLPCSFELRERFLITLAALENAREKKPCFEHLGRDFERFAHLCFGFRIALAIATQEIGSVVEQHGIVRAAPATPICNERVVVALFRLELLAEHTPRALVFGPEIEIAAERREHRVFRPELLVDGGEQD